MNRSNYRGLGYKVTPQTHERIEDAATAIGISKTSVVEFAIFDLSRRFSFFKERLANTPHWLSMNNEITSIFDSMLVGDPRLTQWDKPIVKIYNVAYGFSMEMKYSDMPKREVRKKFRAMIARTIEGLKELDKRIQKDQIEER